MRQVLVDAEMQVDEYGTIWKGEPGADGSIVVGDLLYDENTPDGTPVIRFLPEEEWHAVRHLDNGKTLLGGQEITDDELEGAAQRVIINYGSVPSWMQRVHQLRLWNGQTATSGHEYYEVVVPHDTSI